MSLLKIETPETATGEIKAVYDRFLEGIGEVPEPLLLFSASPAMFERQMAVNLYFRSHPSLSFPLQCLIRYLSATSCRNDACVRINEALLERQGMSAEEIRELHRDTASAPVEAREQRLLALVLRAMSNPEGIANHDVEALRADGWSDADIFDAVYLGVMMISTGFLARIFDERGAR